MAVTPGVAGMPAIGSTSAIFSTSSIDSTKYRLSVSRTFFGMSARSFSLSLGTMIVFNPERCAASTFSFTPPIGSTLPRRVISPVLAGHQRRFDHEDLAADFRPRQTGRDADLVLFFRQRRTEARHAQILGDLRRRDLLAELLAGDDDLAGDLAADGRDLALEVPH